MSLPTLTFNFHISPMIRYYYCLLLFFDEETEPYDDITKLMAILLCFYFPVS